MKLEHNFRLETGLAFDTVPDAGVVLPVSFALIARLLKQAWNNRITLCRARKYKKWLDASLAENHR